MTLYALGLKPKAEIDELAQAAIDKTHVDPSEEKWSYEDICNMDFRWCWNGDCYTLRCFHRHLHGPAEHQHRPEISLTTTAWTCGSRASSAQRRGRVRHAHRDQWLYRQTDRSTSLKRATTPMRWRPS